MTLRASAPSRWGKFYTRGQGAILRITPLMKFKPWRSVLLRRSARPFGPFKMRKKLKD
jgi:hypothetical protein